MNDKIIWEDFIKVEMRIGTILAAEELFEARKPAYKILIDFGDFGIKKTSAQITQIYNPEDLIGQQVVAVVNLPAKQITTFMSECLILAGLNKKNETVLIVPERKVKNGILIA